MPELRLHTYDENDEPDVYPFPRALASRDHGAVALLDPEAEEPPPVDSIELASRIEETLEQLQERLDRVKNELESVYRFPTPDEWPPRAA